MRRAIAAAAILVACGSAAPTEAQGNRPPPTSVQEISDWTPIVQPGQSLGSSDEMWVRVLEIDGRRCTLLVEHYDRGAGDSLDCEPRKPG